MKKLQRDLYYELPQKALTLKGQEYDPSEDHWHFFDGVGHYNLHFDLFRETFSQELFDSIKHYFIWRVREFALGTAQSDNQTLIKSCKATYSNSTDVSTITAQDVISFIAQEKIISNQTTLKKSLCYFYELGLPSIAKKDYEIIQQIKLKQNTPGNPVRTCDPVKGPFTEMEFRSLCDAIDEAYLDDRLDENTYLLTLLLVSFGQRPRQMSWLKVCDFITEYGEGGSIRYYIDMPMDKQGHIAARADSRKMEMHSELAEFIQIRIEDIKQEFISLNLENNYDLDQLPLLPYWQNDSVPELKYHLTTGALKYRVNTKIQNVIGTVKDRNGDPMNINSYRFRYTRGTNMMLGGATQDEIAYNMLHTQRDSSDVYMEFGAKYAEIIDKGVAPYHQPVIDAFSGKVFKRPNIVGTRQTYIPVGAAERIDEAGLCVKPSGCAVYLPDSAEPETYLARVPFACYLCLSFNAWDNIDIHREHLEIMERERDLSLKAFNKEGFRKQPGMASPLDPIIIAIKSVIAKIEAGDISEFDETETDIIDSF